MAGRKKSAGEGREEASAHWATTDARPGGGGGADPKVRKAAGWTAEVPWGFSLP